MKKVLLVLAVAGVMVACNNKKKGEKKPDGDTTQQNTNKTNGDNGNTGSNTAAAGVPSFSDPEVQAYANDITQLLNDYKAAIAGKDMTKLADYGTKWANWSGRSTALYTKLANNPEEAKRLGEYVNKITQEWAEAAKAMMPKM